VVAGTTGSPTMDPDGSWRATDTQGRAWRVVYQPRDVDAH